MLWQADGTTARQQRARGEAWVGARLVGRRTRLAELRQQGCLRVCFPRDVSAPLQAVLLNTAGGVTDGDELHTSLAAGPGAALVVATQAAERIYRARAGADAARVTMRVEVAAGARVDYLPQETIFFDWCALDRRLRVDLIGDAVFLGVETLVFGRAASGEILENMYLRDAVALRRDGRLVLHDSVLLRGAVASVLAGRASAAGRGAVATILYAAADAARFLDAMRGAMASDGVVGGASVRDGVLAARLLGRDSRVTRQAVVAMLGVLRGGQPLPRVWSC